MLLKRQQEGNLREIVKCFPENAFNSYSHCRGKRTLPSFVWKSPLKKEPVTNFTEDSAARISGFINSFETHDFKTGWRTDVPIGIN